MFKCSSSSFQSNDQGKFPLFSFLFMEIGLLVLFKC